MFFSLGYIDSLTWRLFATKDLRPNELGMLSLGSESDPIGILIPPNVADFKITSYCSNDCIRSVSKLSI